MKSSSKIKFEVFIVKAFLSIVIAALLTVLSPFTLQAFTESRIVNVSEKISGLEASGENATAILNKSLISIDAESGLSDLFYDLGQVIKIVSIDNSGSRLLLSPDNKKEIYIISIEQGSLIRKIETDYKPSAFCIDPIMNTAYIAQQSRGIIDVLDLTDMTKTNSIVFEEDISDLLCYGEKNLLIAVTQNDQNENGSLQVMNGDGVFKDKYIFDKKLKAVSLDRQQGKAAILTWDGSILKLDIDNSVLSKIAYLRNKTGDIEFRGNKILATDMESGNLLIMDPSSGGILERVFIGESAEHIACSETYCFVSFKKGVMILKEAVPPVISDISVTGITPDSATISWETDRAADSFIEYGESVLYGKLQSLPELTEHHSVTLNELKPITTYHFSLASTNSSGLSSNSGDLVFTTERALSTIELNIVFPSDGGIISKPYTLVTGTVSNSTGNETGVTVNGVVADVYNGQFFVNHLPLAEGENMIMVNAVDVSGQIAQAEIKVYADTTQPYVTLNSNITSGISPLDAYFSVDTAIPNAVSTYQLDGNYEGSFDLDYTGAAFDDVSFTYAYEGVYYPMILVTDSAGNGYTDTVAIVVQNKVELDALLRGKWEGMRSALVRQDVEGALTNISESTKEMYREQFSALSSVLDIIGSEMGQIQQVTVKDNTAEYEIITTRNGSTYSYYLSFIKDSNGIWKIGRF